MSDVISGGKTVDPEREPLVSRQVQTIYSQSADILCCSFSKKLLAICSSDKLARLWMYRMPNGLTSPDIPLVGGEDEAGTPAAATPMSPPPMVVPGGPIGHFVELPQSPLVAHSYAVNCCQFSPDGQYLSTCSQDGRAILWDVKSGRKFALIQHASGASIRVGAFSPDGELFATGCDDDSVGLWDVRSGGRMLKYLEGHECSIVALAFSPDGAFLVTGATDGDLWIWEARHGLGRYIGQMAKAHDLGVTVCAFSPSYASGAKHLLASAGNDDALRLWRVTPTMTGDAETSLYAELTGHSSNIMTLAFRPDGEVLATGSGDKTVLLWDPITGVILGRIVHHHRYVTCVAFSWDGNFLVTGSNDKTAVVWEVGPPSLIDFSSEHQPLETDDVILSSPDGPVFGRKGRARNRGGSASDAALLGRALASDWSTDQVADWVQSLGMDQHRDAFMKHQIDGQELLFLTDTMLKNSLKIDALGHRNKILRGVASLKNNCRQIDGLAGASPCQGHKSAMGRSKSLMGPAVLMNGGPGGAGGRGGGGAGSTDLTSLPYEFFCPITHEPMGDPVVAADGYSYERAAIQAWIRSGKHSSPMTNAPLHNLNVIPNRSLKMLIQKSMC